MLESNLKAGEHPAGIRPRIILHGGAGDISRETLPPDAWDQYRNSLLSILQSSNSLLVGQHASALDTVVHAVQQLELNPLFNAGRGAVFTRRGANELEASVMVSRGRHKRGAAVSLIKSVKSPITLAAEILKRGDAPDNGGAQTHVHISGPSAEQLADSYGLEKCDQSYYFTEKRWQEHLRNLDATDPTWNVHEFLPQGTVGCVALDGSGTVAVATSTGGITNKLDGRIGDTPTFGAGFWAEEWVTHHVTSTLVPSLDPTAIWASAMDFLSSCLPSLHGFQPLRSSASPIRAVAMSGTGHGDSFLRISAVHTAAAALRFSSSPRLMLADTVTWITGPGGELQRIAEDRWKKTAEGQGGMIGVELHHGQGHITCDFNCRGLFRAWVDDQGHHRCMVFKDEY